MDHDDSDQESLNISDVIEVIQTTDPAYVTATNMYGAAGGSEPIAEEAAKRAAYVKIVEQPASKALRFRYECEGRSAGSIPGVNSTPENKTFPSIQIVGYKGRAVVVVSCVTKDEPYKPHPHNLVGKEGCKKGVCTMEMNNESMTMTFSNLGIQCVKKRDIGEALSLRKEIQVDPFRTGFAHRSQPTSIDLNAVRLCFQVFLKGDKGFNFLLAPVVSDPIFDKKAMSDLVICKLSDCSSSVAGGKEIILLCEKVAKEDIQVRFFEEQCGQVTWQDYGDFQPTQVHKQVAISFRTPRYSSLDVTAPVKVHIQLRRPSDGAVSEPLPFELLPLDSDPDNLKRKRQKFGGESSRQLQDNFSHGFDRGGEGGLLMDRNMPSYTLPRVKVVSDAKSTTDLVPAVDRSHVGVPGLCGGLVAGWAGPGPSGLLAVVKHEPGEPTAPYMFGGPPRMAAATPSPQPHESPLSGGGRTPSPSHIANVHAMHGGNVYEYATTYANLYAPNQHHANDLNAAPTTSYGAVGTAIFPQGGPGPSGMGGSGMSQSALSQSAIGNIGMGVASNVHLEHVMPMDQGMGDSANSSSYFGVGLNSAEIVGMFLEQGNMPENLSANLNMSDRPVDTSNEPQENMTDSFTRITINDICELNSMCKRND